MLSLRDRSRVSKLSDRILKIKMGIESLAKEDQGNPNHDPKTGEFTSGSGGSSSDSKDKEKPKVEEEKGSGAGLFRKTVAAILAVKGGSLLGGTVAYWLMSAGVLNPIGAALTAAGVGIYSGGKIYNALTKAVPKLNFKSDADGKKFLDELPKHLSKDQMDKLNTFLQSKAKDWGV